MKGFAKSIVGFLSIPFALLVLGFTGFQTWNLIYETTLDPIMAAIGLILFEGCMLYWWFFFRKEADGLPQMALSLIGAVLGLLLVAGATAIHLGAVDGMALGEHTPARLITIAALINLVLKFTVPLVHPDQFEEIMSNALQGTITLKGYKRAEAKTDEIAQLVADEIGVVLQNRILTDISTRFALPERAQVIEGKATAVVDQSVDPDWIIRQLRHHVDQEQIIQAIVKQKGWHESDARHAVMAEKKKLDEQTRRNRIDNDPTNDELPFVAFAAETRPEPAHIDRDNGVNF